MIAVELFAGAAATWAVLIGVAPPLQVRRVPRRHSTADVSIGYLLLLLPGLALCVGYGLASSDLALVIPNIVAFLMDRRNRGVRCICAHRPPAPGRIDVAVGQPPVPIMGVATKHLTNSPLAVSHEIPPFWYSQMGARRLRPPWGTCRGRVTACCSG